MSHFQSKPLEPINIMESGAWDIGPSYQFISYIGYGSYGHVCHALHVETKEHVAIKKFSHILRDPVVCRRILREIELIYRLNHPSIVKPVELIVDYEKGNIYFVMEYAVTDVKRLLKRQTYLNVHTIKTLVYRLLLGMNYLDSCKVIHRDIKSANILVNAEFEVKICDFNLSRIAPDHNSNNNQLAPQIHNAFSQNSNSNSGTHDPRYKDINEIESMKEGEIDLKCYEELSSDVSKGECSPNSIDCVNQSPKGEQMQQENSSIIRQLTGHVGSRWYRAPEIILLEKSYTSAADMWGVGCVFGELLQMIKGNVAENSERRPLFQGASCFPLSPVNGPCMLIEELPVGIQDQIQVILETLGSPEDLSFLTDMGAKQYIQGFGKYPKANFAQMYPKADSDALDLLAKMLDFNPFTRMTARDALKHPFFKEVRDQSCEITEPQEISLIADTPCSVAELPWLMLKVIKSLPSY